MWTIENAHYKCPSCGALLTEPFTGQQNTCPRCGTLMQEVTCSQLDAALSSESQPNSNPPVNLKHENSARCSTEPEEVDLESKKTLAEPRTRTTTIERHQEAIMECMGLYFEQGIIGKKSRSISSLRNYQIESTLRIFCQVFDEPIRGIDFEILKDKSIALFEQLETTTSTSKPLPKVVKVRFCHNDHAVGRQYTYLWDYNGSCEEPYVGAIVMASTQRGESKAIVELVDVSYNCIQPYVERGTAKTCRLADLEVL